jgi:tetratricopeptide (TPR) repeat protein
MFKKIISLLSIIIFNIVCSQVIAQENFYEQGKKRYLEKKLDDAKFLFQRSIVFNPKETKSYLYLAKIYNLEENQKEEEKNVTTVLLLDPSNEDAIYMLMKINLKKSNYLEVRKSLTNFVKVCKKLCEKEKSILESLKNIEPKNES